MSQQGQAGLMLAQRRRRCANINLACHLSWVFVAYLSERSTYNKDMGRRLLVACFKLFQLCMILQVPASSV